MLKDDNQIIRNLHFNNNGDGFFYYKGEKRFLRYFLRDSGLDFRCFTNAGYFGGVKFIDCDSEIVILQEV